MRAGSTAASPTPTPASAPGSPAATTAASSATGSRRRSRRGPLQHRGRRSSTATVALGPARPALHFLRAGTETVMYTDHYGLTERPFQLTPGRALLVREPHPQEGDGLSRLRPRPGRRLHRHHRRDRRRQVDPGRPSDGDDRPRAAERDQPRLDPGRGRRHAPPRRPGPRPRHRRRREGAAARRGSSSGSTRSCAPASAPC